MKKSLLALYVLVILVIATGIYVWSNHSSSPSVKAPVTTTKRSSASGGFNKQQLSTSDPNSIWVIVNKKHPLPSGFVPSDLVVPNVPLNLSSDNQQMHVSSAMAPSLASLFAGAHSAGLSLKLNSGYRSEALQKQLFDSYAVRDGAAAAATYSAYPGTSEHQTGLASDVMAANGQCNLEICFADTPEGQWLTAHAHEYGFIIRYPKGKESITTYQYEPWHIRYVGNDLASQIYSSGLTMEEFFGYN